MRASSGIGTKYKANIHEAKSCLYTVCLMVTIRSTMRYPSGNHVGEDVSAPHGKGEVSMCILHKKEERGKGREKGGKKSHSCQVLWMSKGELH